MESQSCEITYILNDILRTSPKKLNDFLNHRQSSYEWKNVNVQHYQSDSVKACSGLYIRAIHLPRSQLDYSLSCVI